VGVLDNRIDKRFKRTWEFFLAHAGNLMLGGLVVIAGSLVVLPGPWFALNLVQETLECVRTGRPVRWQAAFDRKGNFLRAWWLTLAMGVPLLVGFALLILPGVLLSLYWFLAPVLVADGRKVVDALSESGRIFMRRKDWATYFLNWLVPCVLWSLGGITAFAFVLTLPLSLTYLVLCYTDEIGTVPVEPPGVGLRA
jgi:hypothetical protein